MKKWLFLTILLISFCFADGPWNFSYTGGVQSWTVPDDGKYKLEVWGAQGGNTSPNGNNSNDKNDYYGGKGGYAVGTVSLTKGTVLYITVGGAGGYGGNYAQTGAGGYNGGASGHGSDGNWGIAWGPGGGGATHIAKVSGTLSGIGKTSFDSNGLIVAGGGGGASRYDGAGDANGSEDQACNGGAGGGSSTNGTFGQGSGGYRSRYNTGGGGGGYYGGVARQGGSSWTHSSLTSVTKTAGQNSGNGKATITLVELAIKKDSSISAKTNLVYNGSTITGVNYANVNISGHQATDAGTYTATATPASGHAWADGSTGAKNINWTIAKANSSITTAPTSKQLIYNEANQELVTAGTANGGTMKYKIGNDGAWNETLPLGNTPGDYVIFYKVFGDGNHNDTSEGSLTSTILQNWKRYTINCLTDSSGNPVRPNVSIIGGTYTIKSAIFDVKAQDSNPYKFCIGKGITVSETNYNGTQPDVYYPENGDLN